MICSVPRNYAQYETTKSASKKIVHLEKRIASCSEEASYQLSQALGGARYTSPSLGHPSTNKTEGTIHALTEMGNMSNFCDESSTIQAHLIG